MSAVAKLLLASDLDVSGSDIAANEQTEKLVQTGARINIGHSADNLPLSADIVIFSSAVPSSNQERAEARRRGIREMTNFEFLGEWFASAKTILVTGTHGKSTTTAMLGLILERAGLDPTVIVGSVVPSFPDGNLRIGKSDLVVIEGDEYAKHFLAFRPYGLVINNLELDHTDFFPTIEDLKSAFRELIDQVVESGFVVANTEDANVRDVVGATHPSPMQAHVLPIQKTHASFLQKKMRILPLIYPLPSPSPFVRGRAGRGWNLQVPGRFNQMNASAAATAARELGVSEEVITTALESFHGIWRRFEFLGERNGARFYSDYAHHPTAVAATLEAAHDILNSARASNPQGRVLLCFQPHHRNRTKHLFWEFVSSFDRADALILCEIYDVAGREAAKDADVSSQDLLDAIVRHDLDRGVSRIVEYAPDPDAAVHRILEIAAPDDVVIIMGAGDIDAAGREKI